MTAKFDVKSSARSLSKMMAMADECVSQPGGAIHTQRLTDYCSHEYQRMSEKQILAVLEAIDARYENKLYENGHGEIIGFAYSKRIFVGLRREQNDDE